ncbi:CRS2-associated factor 1, mitochondrial isoform X1 [Cryptomeria japonica]|uniref:CRS2-associated factor 1, mitochondrial isoform X1 n=1 Tax=Cryptomeria japonica TaxID=3369 RepID=UPI0027DA84D5|nr:CRS2-associated factor 1, mitochondrial isoform X1 [Cryptomeria japonica]
MTAISRRFCHNLRHYSSSQKYSWITPKFIEPEDTTPLIKPRWSKPSPAVKKRKISPYKPPSSLDRTGQKPYSPDLHFDFQFSYTETPRAKPIGFREARFSPFGPGKIDREWTGWCAPHASSEVTSIEGDDDNQDSSLNVYKYGGRFREEILGEPLSKQEIQALIDQCRQQNTKRQVNLGRDGLTHNMINDIHNNWRYAPAVRIKCLGVPTVDMKKVCFQLEDKTGGKIIYHNHNIITLYRGRNYKPKERPIIPLMLWKPHTPVYPRLIKTTVDGFTVAETKAMRKRGLNTPPLTKLKKNGVYCGLVHNVRDAFKNNDLARIDCKGLPKSDYRKIGAKLRDLVPCVLVTFEKEQIVIWSGKNAALLKTSLYLQGSKYVPLDRTKSLMIVKESPLVPLEYFSNIFLPQRLCNVSHGG